jgi:hypothetical protein
LKLAWWLAIRAGVGGIMGGNADYDPPGAARLYAAAMHHTVNSVYHLTNRIKFA